MGDVDNAEAPLESTGGPDAADSNVMADTDKTDGQDKKKRRVFVSSLEEFRPKLDAEQIQIENELSRQHSFKSAVGNAERLGGRSLPRSRMFAMARLPSSKELERNTNFRVSPTEGQPKKAVVKAKASKKARTDLWKEARGIYGKEAWQNAVPAK